MSRRKKGSVPSPPADLSPDSTALWEALAQDVVVTMGGAQVDFVVLYDLLLARDRLAEIRETLATEGLIVTGSKGQSRPHPLLVSESVLRREVAQGLRRLRLDSAERYRFDVGPDGRLKDSY